MKKRKRILSAILAGVLIFAMLVSLVVSVAISAKAVTQDEIDKLREQASELKTQKSEIADTLSRLRSERASIVAQKNLLDESIELTKQEIQNISDRIVILEEDIEEKNRQYELAVSEEEKQKELFRTRVRAMEEDGEVSYIEIFFQATSFSDLLSIVDSITDVMNYDEWVVEQLNAAQAATLSAKEELEAGKTEAENSRAELVAKQEELETEMAEADELMAAVERNIEENETAYYEIEAAEKEAAEEIDEKVAELERIEEERRRQEMLNSGAHVNATGVYRWPSQSSYYVTSLFGTRLHPVYQTYRTHYGIDIGASYGTNVLAADGGVVVTSEYSSSYGNYVMISHGNGNYTLYAHMSSRLVSVGDNVTKGQVVGLVGSTGVSTGPHIHFEVYEGGVRVDPLQYFSNYVVID